MSAHSARGRPWRRRRAEILATTTVCWICGHPGSDSIDHIVPRSRALRMGWTTKQVDAPENLRPAHHDPCPTCGQRCNQQRGATMTTNQTMRTTQRW